MIQAVTSTNYPYLQVHVQVGPDRRSPHFEFDAEPLVDTGFDGGLAVPPGTIPGHVPLSGQLPWTLADGSDLTTDFYVGYVIIGHLRPVPTVIIALSGDTLLGRHVIDNFRLTFDHGSTILVEA
jgi:predicted aspartyl protease